MMIKIAFSVLKKKKKKRKEKEWVTVSFGGPIQLFMFYFWLIIYHHGVFSHHELGNIAYK